ncbi:MAG: hypothetical protein QE263_03885 [Vampirovibrionales bacterium]|nr:hypothetical protein [Vampirovibrionales bacterium]
MTLLLKSRLLLLVISTTICLGFTACSSGPTFYDEAAPLTPPPFSPPTLKTVDMPPLSSGSSDPTASLEALDEDTEEAVSSNSKAKNPTFSSADTPLSGPLSSPLASSNTPSKKSNSSSVTPTNGSLKKP